MLALYARVSSQQQAEANTIASQVGPCGADSRRRPRTREPSSASSTRATAAAPSSGPRLERLRDQAAGRFDRLYVHSPDRLARTYAYQCPARGGTAAAGVEIVFLNRDIGKSPEDNLLLQMQGMMAEYERAKILERSPRGKRHAARAGAVSAGQAPLRLPLRQQARGRRPGALRDPRSPGPRSSGRFSPGWAWSGVRSARSVGGCSSRTSAAPAARTDWDRSTVWGILKNPAYQGEAQFGKTRVGPLRPDCGRNAADRYSHGTRHSTR